VCSDNIIKLLPPCSLVWSVDSVLVLVVRCLDVYYLLPIFYDALHLLGQGRDTCMQSRVPQRKEVQTASTIYASSLLLSE
jgi:hypothetical protein